MKYYTIDLAGVTDLSEFYQKIIKGLEFPDWCGENLDAIWDMLTGYMETPVHITVIGGKAITDILEEKFQILKDTFDEFVEWHKKYDEEVIIVYK